MGRYVVAYVVAAVCFFAVDMVWLGVIAKDMYRSALGEWLRDPPLWWAAILFYALYMLGLVRFGVAPALDGGTWGTAFVNGALFGFFTYMTYDLTNLATLKGWPLHVTLADIVWGTVLSGSASGVAWFAASAMRKS